MQEISIGLALSPSRQQVQPGDFSYLGCLAPVPLLVVLMFGLGNPGKKTDFRTCPGAVPSAVSAKQQSLILACDWKRQVSSSPGRTEDRATKLTILEMLVAFTRFFVQCPGAGRLLFEGGLRTGLPEANGKSLRRWDDGHCSWLLPGRMVGTWSLGEREIPGMGPGELLWDEWRQLNALVCQDLLPGNYRHGDLQAFRVETDNSGFSRVAGAD